MRILLVNLFSWRIVMLIKVTSFALLILILILSLFYLCPAAIVTVKVTVKYVVIILFDGNCY